MTEKKKTEFVGMLHIPINSIVTAPASWQDALGLPSATAGDWEIIASMDDVGCDPGRRRELHFLAERLSFYTYLKDRMIREASLYSKYNADAMLLENTGAPYFVRGHQPAVIFAVMSCLAGELRAEFPESRFGIQVLAFSDDLAMEIAVQNRFSFIRSESALFEGVRPEGRTPNYGNLAKLYMQRNMLTALDDRYDGPLVLVDIQKKHTEYAASLQRMETWFDNVMFQKIEGVVLTGPETGSPVAEDDFRKTVSFLNELKAKYDDSPFKSCIPLLYLGSGVSKENIAVCRRYADGVIVGSSLKEHGYWELPIKEETLKQFMEKWHEE